MWLRIQLLKNGAGMILKSLLAECRENAEKICWAEPIQKFENARSWMNVQNDANLNCNACIITYSRSIFADLYQEQSLDRSGRFLELSKFTNAMAERTSSVEQILAFLETT